MGVLTLTDTCRAPECDREANGFLGLCWPHYRRFNRYGDFACSIRQVSHEAPTFGNNCPTCADGGIVCPYFAVDGRVVEWRCIADGHQPDTYLGRNFPARMAA